MPTFPRKHKRTRSPVEGYEHDLTYIRGKVRKHRFEGDNPAHCTKQGCGKPFASVIHK